MFFPSRCTEIIPIRASFMTKCRFKIKKLFFFSWFGATISSFIHNGECVFVVKVVFMKSSEYRVIIESVKGVSLSVEALRIWNI